MFCQACRTASVRAIAPKRATITCQYWHTRGSAIHITYPYIHVWPERTIHYTNINSYIYMRMCTRLHIYSYTRNTMCISNVTSSHRPHSLPTKRTRIRTRPFGVMSARRNKRWPPAAAASTAHETKRNALTAALYRSVPTLTLFWVPLQHFQLCTPRSA